MQPFSIDSLSGLSGAEVSRLREQEGYNEIPSDRRPSPAAIVVGVLREPMFLLLVAAGAISSLPGDGVVGESSGGHACSGTKR